jgi:hypothetical protein
MENPRSLITSRVCMFLSYIAVIDPMVLKIPLSPCNSRLTNAKRLVIIIRSLPLVKASLGLILLLLSILKC